MDRLPKHDKNELFQKGIDLDSVRDLHRTFSVQLRHRQRFEKYAKTRFTQQPQPMSVNDFKSAVFQRFPNLEYEDDLSLLQNLADLVWIDSDEVSIQAIEMLKIARGTIEWTDEVQLLVLSKFDIVFNTRNYTLLNAYLDLLIELTIHSQLKEQNLNEIILNLASLLNNYDPPLSSRILNLFGNLLCDWGQLGQIMMQANVLKYIIDQVSYITWHNNRDFIQTSFFLSSLVRCFDNSDNNLKIVWQVFQAILQFATEDPNEQEAVCNCLITFQQYVLHPSINKSIIGAIRTIALSGSIPYILKLLKSQSMQERKETLRVVLGLTLGNKCEVQYLINNDGLSLLMKIALDKTDVKQRDWAINALLNIAKTRDDFAEKILAHTCLNSVLRLSEECSEYSTQLSVQKLLQICIFRCMEPSLCDLVQNGIQITLESHLKSQDTNVVKKALENLKYLLKYHYIHAENYDTGLIDQLEQQVLNPNKEISEICEKIISEFLDGDENTEQQFYKYDVVPINFIYS